MDTISPSCIPVVRTWSEQVVNANNQTAIGIRRRFDSLPNDEGWQGKGNRGLIFHPIFLIVRGEVAAPA